MARKIRFPLKMKNGAEVRTLEELRENFDLESILGYFTDGKLAIWLSDRYYDEKANAISALSTDMTDLNSKLCEILEVEYHSENDATNLEFIQRYKEKFNILSNIISDKEILDNVDIVALNQNDLYGILDESPNKVYLYGDVFNIPFEKKNICYVGINNPKVSIEKTKYVFEYNEAGIYFQNVCFDEGINPYVTKGELLFLENKYKEAFPLIEEAAENGNPRAMYILAMMYNDGTGVYIDKNKCKEWLRKANGLNEPLSMYGYISWCLDNKEQGKMYSQIFNDIKNLAKSGDVFAEVRLGFMYENGYGVSKNYSKAIEWYKKATENGNTKAQNSLGDMYYLGNGVTKDYSKAIEWYRKAAEQGYAIAQYNLGYMYDNGKGVSKDYSKAVEWYKKAAKNGNINAINELKYLEYINHKKH